MSDLGCVVVIDSQVAGTNMGTCPTRYRRTDLPLLVCEPAAGPVRSFA
jgi:hypothetical protein